MSGTIDKIKAKVENVLHKDKDTTHNTTTTSHNDPTGPHSSHAANKADPRVDSDRIGAAGNHGSAAHGTGAGLTGATGTHTGTHTSSGLTGNNTYGSDPTGPHDSHLANKADPRVDSDRVGAAGNTGSARYDTGAGLTGSTGHSGIGSTGHSSGLTGNTYGSDPTGPHDSRLGNKADPRVDSDRVGGLGNTSSAGGYGTTHNTHGAGVGGLHSGPGPAPDTAGPHKQDMLNKLDPRVDSDLDGSKTVGGNKTSGY
jgi:hypothetical protein